MSRNYSIDGYKKGSPDRNNPYNVIPSGRITMGNVPHPVMGIDDMGNRQLMQPGGEYQFPGNRVFEIPIKDTNMNKKKMKMGGSTKFWDGTKWVSSADDSGTYNNGVYYQRGGAYTPAYQFTGAAAISPNAEDSSLYNSQFNTGMDMINNNPAELINRYNYWQNVQQNHSMPNTQEDYNNLIGGQRINQNTLDAWKDAGTQYIQRNYPVKGYPGGPSRKQLLNTVSQYEQGGPTYPKWGAGAMFGYGGTASFNVSNNSYPTPFAMAPGTGNGGGMLQDLPTTMQMGGYSTRDGEYVYPFAMYAGSGQGSGMLQDLPTEMKKGGIYIKPSKRGTFTAAASKHGKGVQEFASQVLAHKENYSPAMVKKANFAHNAAKWHHEYGGSTVEQYGGIPDHDGNIDIMKSGGNWIKGAVNPAHKGYYQQGGQVDQYQVGGTYEVDDDEYNRLKSMGYKFRDL